MDIEGFAELGMSGSDAVYTAAFDESIPELRAFARGGRIPTRPVRFRWLGGRGTPSDAVWPCVGVLVASPRFAALLADFTGWRPFAVEVFDKRGEPVPGYVGVSITGRCGPIRCDVSRTTGSGPLRSYIGLLFDRPTWDGTDLFVPPNMGFILMSPRLAKAVRRAKIGNVQVEALSDFEMMAFLVREDGYPKQDVWA